MPIDASRIWASGPSKVYAVGHLGQIGLWNGASWQKLSSGTTLDIRDIWGASSSFPARQEIIAVASGNSPEEGKRLLRIDGTTVTAIPDSGLSWALYGVWFEPGKEYFVVGAGIGHKNQLDSSPWNVYPSGVVTKYMSGGVRGNAANDVFVVGSFMECVHYNGSTWHNYSDQIPFANGELGMVAMKGNLVIAVGLVDQRAVAVVGRRIQ